MILGSFFTSRGAFKGRFPLPLLAPLKWEESLPFVRPGRVAAISQLLLWVCGLWIWGWDSGLSWSLVHLHRWPLLEPEYLVRIARKLHSFSHCSCGREKGNSVASELIREYFFHCSFLFLLTPLLTYFLFFNFYFFLVWFLWTPFLHYHWPYIGFSSLCPTLPYLFLCLFCGIAQEGNFDSLRSPSCIESQNHPVFSFSYSSDFCKVKDSLL